MKRRVLIFVAAEVVPGNRTEDSVMFDNLQDEIDKELVKLGPDWEVVSAFSSISPGTHETVPMIVSTIVVEKIQ